MRVARVLAQGKVNLLLRVLSREETGYHQIETIFQRIDLGDEVVVRCGGKLRSIDCSGPMLPSAGLGPAGQNLAFRAATAYSRAAGWPEGFAIELTKQLPVGGGVGGGSADAGAVLRALNSVAPRPLSSGRLRAVAAELGADVPFLVGDLAIAHGTGRGDRLRGRAPLAARNVILLVPRFSVATADAYRWIDEARAAGDTPSRAAHAGEAVEAESWEAVAAISANDFEPVVERRHPELRRLRGRLRDSGAAIARLAGSGSSVFGIFENDPAAGDYGVDTLVLQTRTSTRVVPVEVLQ